MLAGAINACTGAQQQLNALVVALLTRGVERRHTILIGIVHRRAVEQCAILLLQVPLQLRKLAVEGSRAHLGAECALRRHFHKSHAKYAYR